MMMHRPALYIFTLFGILSCGHVFAQGLNPASLVAQYESNFNPTATNPTSTSSGLYGMINSTWAEALQLCGSCGSTAQYPNEASAPSSVQTAAFDALVNQNGLSDYTCPGCDPPLVAALNANGGPGAYQLSGLSTDPTSFASLDTATGLSDFFGNPSGTGTGTSTGPGGDTLSGTNGPPSGAAPSASSLPFEWIYSQVITNVLGQIDTSIQIVENIASGPATTLLALAIAVMGIMTLFGNMDMPTFSSWAIRAALVMAFIQVGNTFYSDWVEGLVLGLPDYFANAFSLTGVGGAPGQLFDQILNGWWASVLAVWHSSPWSLHALFIGGALLATTVLIVLPSLVAMFTVFLISTFLLLVMLTIGPLMILALLFRATHRFLHGYVNVMVTGVIFVLVVDIVLGIFSSILTQVMSNFSPSGSPDTDVPGLFGLAVTMFITGLTMARLPRLVESIGGAVAVSMETAGRYVAGGAIADVGAGAAAIATRAI